MLVGLERDIRELQLSLPLHVDPERAVDHDLGDGVVVEKGLDGAEAEDLVDDLLEHPLALDPGDDRPVLVDEPVEHALDLGAHGLHVREVQPGVEVIDDPRLERGPEVPVEVPGRDRGLGEGAGGRGLRAEGAVLGAVGGPWGRRAFGGPRRTLAFDPPQ